MNSVIAKENPKTVLPNPPLSEEEPSTSVAETLDSTSNAVVGVSRVHDPPPSGKDPPIRSLSPEEEEEIDLAEKRETGTCKDGVACKDIDAGKEASEDIDSERQGIRDTDESENKAENAKASSLEGVVEIGAIENGNGEGEKEVQGNKADELDKDEDNREPDEADLVKPPPHWFPKACIRLAVAGGCISEEVCCFAVETTQFHLYDTTCAQYYADMAVNCC